MTSDKINRGLAAMPAQERSLPVDGQSHGGESPSPGRWGREAMARNASPQGPGQGSGQGSVHEAKQTSKPRSRARADARSGHRDGADWDHDHDEAAGHHARRLLSRSNSRLHRIGDNLAALKRWLTGERWVRRVAIVIAALMAIFAGCFGALWWRLGAGPINLDMATPWLAVPVEEKNAHGKTAQAGGA